MNESSLSFISSLSSKDDDSIILPDAINVNASGDLSSEASIRADDLAHDLINISFDKNDLNPVTIESNLSSVDSISNIQQFSVLNDSNLTKNNVQSTVSNFIPSVSPAKTVELSTIRTTVANANKPNAAQLLIFQKPPTSMPTMLVGKGGGIPVVSATSVALVQPSTVVSSGTKILTMPALNAAGNLINAVNPSSSGKTGDVKILLSGVPCSSSLMTTKSVNSTTVSTLNSSLQGPLKRAVTPSSTGQMITKVIITNNASSNPTLVSPVPVSASPATPVSVANQPQSILLASPNKAFAFPRSVLNVSGPQQIIRNLPGSPTKQYVLSPVKPNQKVAYGPVTYSRSPRRIAPATIATISTLNAGAKMATVVCPTSVTPIISSVKLPVQQSPTKVVLKPVSQTILKPLSVNSSSTVNTTFTTVSNTSATATLHQGTQQISTTAQAVQMSGNKLHYVRLVTAPSTSTATSIVTAKKEATLVPVSSVTAISSGINTGTSIVTLTSTTQSRPTVPIAPAKLVTPKQIGPKFLIPAASNSQIRPAGTLNSNQIGQLPAGTLIPVAGGSQSYVMVPAQYVTQLQQPASSQVTGTQMLNILPAPTPPSSSNVSVYAQSAHISLTSNPTNTFHSANASSTHSSAHHSPRHVNGRTPVENDSRQRKPCNCTKSQCLKLYCDCFANGEFCNNCNCNNCYNNLAHEEERQKAIKACLDRNPLAFHPKIGKSREGDQERRHTKGCNCKRSGCLKNYCECYEAKILCTNLCKCIGCKNFEDSSERKTLMHLADAAEVRVQQQAAAKTNLSSEILDIPSKPPVMSRTGERLPFAFVTDDVLEATCLCLLAHASDAEKSHTPEEEIERLVLQEFGRCLVRIIDCANKTKVTKMDVQ